jgi:hypothetical protein
VELLRLPVISKQRIASIFWAWPTMVATNVMNDFKLTAKLTSKARSVSWKMHDVEFLVVPDVLNSLLALPGDCDIAYEIRCVRRCMSASGTPLTTPVQSTV